MTHRTRRVLLLAAMLAAAPALALAQAMPRPDTAAVSRALTQEVLGIFQSVCLASAVSGEAVPAAVARVLGQAASGLPAGQLRGNDRVRETAGWLIDGQHGRYRLSTIEPGGQCGLTAEGVDHDAFLDGTAQIIARGTELMPGWTPPAAPHRSSGERPFGTLTYVAANFTRATAPRVLSVTGSAASRTDGRPNTGVISSALHDRMP
ncbi:hypothetical protein [Roseomonas sp. CECT 9278]|uniref:hypothetical protein n=1 Tax=Roseomonas sp. CECT 9278 TaxID=2845823 RepID=UPI001E2E4A17|nr:hypothetical protein [Roseomonas sp. CECT 9278]CAH0284330.1 hypothetical protein ROS9278_04034 [Roseomonas sp. CECT 9278]